MSEPTSQTGIPNQVEAAEPTIDNSTQSNAAPTFKEQVQGYAKKFAGQTFGKDHEVATGESLLAGHGKETAIQKGEQVKQS